MKITLLCSDPSHPVNGYLEAWAQSRASAHEIELVTAKAELDGGDLLFLISCSELITPVETAKYGVSLVLHASDLPRGRGWSPHIWELARGEDVITVSLLEVEDKVDSGKIWKKETISVPAHALWDEVSHLLFEAEIGLINFAIKNFRDISPTPQPVCESATYYPRRTPANSRLDVNKTIAEQFNLIRVSDPQRFPAYFDYLGHRYLLKLEKIHEK